MDAALAYRAHNALGLAGRVVFPGHGTRNVRLGVDVVDTGLADDVRTLILVLPWAIEGVIFVPDEHFPSSIVIGGRRYRVFHHELPDLGRFRTVELVPDVTALPSARHARKIAYLIGPPFRDAVARARRQILTDDRSLPRRDGRRRARGHRRGRWGVRGSGPHRGHARERGPGAPALRRRALERDGLRRIASSGRRALMRRISS